MMMEREAVIVYAVVEYVGLDAEGHIHMILDKGKYADLYMTLLKAYEGKSCMVKVMEIKRRNK